MHLLLHRWTVLFDGSSLDATAAAAVIDRIVVKPGLTSRVTGAVETALQLGGGSLLAVITPPEGAKGKKKKRRAVLSSSDTSDKEYECIGVRARCLRVGLEIMNARPVLVS